MVDKPSWSDNNEAEETTCTKIYYSSRIHSQLSQVLPELRKLKLAPASVKNLHPTTGVQTPFTPQKRKLEEKDEEDKVSVTTRTVSLGSRKQLCINDKLRSKARDLDEACRELLGGWSCNSNDYSYF